MTKTEENNRIEFNLLVKRFKKFEKEEKQELNMRNDGSQLSHVSKGGR